MVHPQRKRQPKSHNQKQIGQALVEFSLILPMLLIIVLGIIDFGRILFIYSNVATSTRNAARQATLTGTHPIEGVARYIACDNIEDLAYDFFGSDGATQSIDILYFDTTDPVAPSTLATLATALDALDSNTVSTLDGADYDCNNNDDSNFANLMSRYRGAGRIVNSGVLSTGDLMVVLVDVQLEFITPFLELMDAFFDRSAPGTFDVTFRAQRTIVESLVLNISGTDRDGDGLSDTWEYGRFGCVLENTDDQTTPVYILPDGALVISQIASPGWTYILSTYDPVPPDDPLLETTGTGVASGYSSAPASTSDCARENVSETLFASASEWAWLDCDPASDTASDTDILQDCIIVSLDLFNSLSDPDGDNLFNGVEEARGTAPISSLTGVIGTDTDGDGLSDLAEDGLGSCPSLPSTLLACNGVTDARDSDGDGIWDGDERCEIEDVTELDGCSSDLGTHGWTKTNPLDDDTDNDGLEDGAEIDTHNTSPINRDHDGDGVNDGWEVNGFDMGITINGIFRTESIGSLNPLVGDSDFDGIDDGLEVFGYSITNNIDGTITVYSRPDDPDTDNDGVCDGPGIVVTCSGGVSLQDINPIETDTDNDGLTDGEEQITYSTLADDTHSDDDADTSVSEVCQAFDGSPLPTLSDAEEMRGAQAYVDTDGDLDVDDDDLDVDGDGLYNAADWDSDGDGLSDCAEFYIHFTNPYNADSDGDRLIGNGLLPSQDWNDFAEVNDACLDPNTANVLATYNTCTANYATDNENGDGTGDGIPDFWELLYFPDISNVPTSDTDGDGCDLQCEYDLSLDPKDADSDDDRLTDGVEITIGTDPRDSDMDNDGLLDGQEGRTVWSPDQTLGTCLDPGYWDPGLPPTATLLDDDPNDCYNSDPRLRDTDNDGLFDLAEVNNSLSYNSVNYTTNPDNPDTDGDGIWDGPEASTGLALSYSVRMQGLNAGALTAVNITVYTHANDTDSDGDGLTDFNEFNRYDLNPTDDDTDNDGIKDGTIALLRGERDNDADPATYPGYNTNPLWQDSDDDGLSDWQEINPETALLIPSVYAILDDDNSHIGAIVGTYEVSYTNSSSTAVDESRPLAGYDPNTPTSLFNLNPNNGDSDGDGLSDYDEINTSFTDPEDADTDDDFLADGADAQPLFWNNPNPDTDGDGLTDADEATFLTDPTTDWDSDDDGLIDTFEFNTIPISYGWIDTTGTNQTFSGSVQTLGHSTVTNSPFGYSDGFDGDYDGIMDSFEIYWNDQANANINTAHGFTTFAAATPAGECAYLTGGNLPVGAPFIVGQPLDPIKQDTDGDGLYDNYECINGLNPFDGSTAGGYQYTSKITNGTLLQAVSQASSGDYEGAANTLVGVIDVNTGLVSITITRTNNPDVGLDFTSAPYCTPSWDTTNDILIPSACGVGTEPVNPNGPSGNDFTISMAPAAILEYIINDATGSNFIVSLTTP